MVKTYKQKFNSKYGFPLTQSHSLKEISDLSGFKLSSLKKIVEKGEGAFYVKSKEQWAQARVYSAVMGGKAAKIDKDLLKIK